MSIQFDWQAGNDGGEWETIAETRRRQWLRQVPRWVWYVASTALVVALAGGYFVVRQRYEQAHREMVFQVQSVIDLEARAYAQGDAELFLAQQDRESPDWYDLQKARLRAGCHPDDLAWAHCSPVLPAKIEDLTLRGDTAWVEVIEGDPPMRRARFYRQTELGWKHTSPRPEFWGTAIELHYGDVILRYHRKDQPYVDPIADRTVKSFYETCRHVGCPPDQSLEINFAVDEFLPVTVPPPLKDATWLLPSPWLSGLPVDASAETPYLDAMADQLARDMATQALSGASARDLDPLQRTIVHEYVAWQRERDTTQAPILGYIVDLRGPGVLPGLFEWLADHRSTTLDALLGRWLSLSPAGPGPVHFAALLNIERMALLAGQRETFLSLQEGEGTWIEQRSDFYDQVQTYDAMPIDLKVDIQVQEVRTVGTHALLTLNQPLPRLQGYAPPSLGRYVFFTLRGGEWKHSSIGHALYWEVPLDQVRLAPPMPIPGDAEDVVTISFPHTQSPAKVRRWAQAFQARYPWVRVREISLDWTVLFPDFDTETLPMWGYIYQIASYQIAAMADVMPWLFFTEMTVPGVVRDLEPFIESDPTFDSTDYYPGMLEACRWAGGTWALPAYGVPYLIYYDEAAFDRTGTPYPQPGWTLEDFSDAASALTIRQGQETIRYGFVDRSEAPLTRAFVEARTGPLVDTSTSPPTIRLDDPRTVQAVQWYADQGKDGVMPNPYRLGVEGDERAFRQYLSLLGRGEVAMWAEAALPSSEGQRREGVGVVSFPMGQYPLNPWYIQTYAMSGGTLHPEESWLWLRFVLTQHEMEASSGRVEEGIPARRSVAEAAGIWSEWDEETTAAIQEAMDRAWNLRWDVCTFALQDALEQGWSGVPVQQALDEAQAMVERGYR